jgi:hypothetical protein
LQIQEYMENLRASVFRRCREYGWEDGSTDSGSICVTDYSVRRE